MGVFPVRTRPAPTPACLHLVRSSKCRVYSSYSSRKRFLFWFRFGKDQGSTKDPCMSSSSNSNSNKRPKGTRQDRQVSSTEEFCPDLLALPPPLLLDGSYDMFGPRAAVRTLLVPLLFCYKNKFLIYSNFVCHERTRIYEGIWDLQKGKS